MHIHIPDGVLPPWLWLTGYFLAGLFLAIALKRIKQSPESSKRIPRAGLLLAFTLLATSLPLGFFSHLNLMVFNGILLGGAWSFVVSLSLNFLLAFFGHGAITIVGLNTIFLWLQALLGILLFRVFSKLLKNPFLSSFIACFTSLSLSFVSLLALLFVSVEFAESVFVALSLPVFIFEVLIESLVTGFIINFLSKTKPDLLS